VQASLLSPTKFASRINQLSNGETLKIININRIVKPYKTKNEYKIFVAYFLGSTRLIDNI
jgi:pantothenate synthetase